MRKILLSMALFALILAMSFSVSATSEDVGYLRIETGEAHVAALKEDGTVWCWGSNLAGALGDGTTRSRYVPSQALGVSGAVDIAAGRYFTVALMEDGTVWGWGSNYANQLGFDQNVTWEVPIPRQLPNLSNITAIYVNDIEFYAVDQEGNRYLNTHYHSPAYEYPPLTDEDGEYRKIEFGRNTLALGMKKDGTVWLRNTFYCLKNPHDFKELPEFAGARDLAVFSGDTAYIIDSKGVLYALGDNKYGQLGNGFSTYSYVPHLLEGFTDAVAVSASYDNSYVLHGDGSVSLLYFRENGRMDQSYRHRKLPIQNVKKIVQTSAAVFALKEDGTLWKWSHGWFTWAGEDFFKPEKVEGLSGLVNIRANYDNVIAFDRSGQVFVNSVGRRAYETISVAATKAEDFFRVLNIPPARDGNYTADVFVLLTLDDRLLVQYARFKYDENGDAVLVPRNWREVDFGGAVAEIAVNTSFAEYVVALLADGTLASVYVTEGKALHWEGISDVVEINTSFDAELALRKDGVLRQYGGNMSNMGLDDSTALFNFYPFDRIYPIKSISADYYHQFAITQDGALYAWGENGDGQLFESPHYNNSYEKWQPVKKSVLRFTIGSTTMYDNNRPVTIPAAPRIVEERTLLPVRELTEALGGTVTWEVGGMVTVKHQEVTLVFLIGEPQVIRNGVAEPLDVAPALFEDKTFLPLRYICEALGAEVLWEGAARKITVVQ